jgi:hypothetical protein
LARQPGIHTLCTPHIHVSETWSRISEERSELPTWFCGRAGVSEQYSVIAFKNVPNSQKVVAGMRVRVHVGVYERVRACPWTRPCVCVGDQVGGGIMRISRGSKPQLIFL